MKGNVQIFTPPPPIYIAEGALFKRRERANWPFLSFCPLQVNMMSPNHATHSEEEKRVRREEERHKRKSREDAPFWCEIDTETRKSAAPPSFALRGNAKEYAHPIHYFKRYPSSDAKKRLLDLCSFATGKNRKRSFKQNINFRGKIPPCRYDNVFPLA